MKRSLAKSSISESQVMILSEMTVQLGGGVVFLVKHDLVINKEYRNSDFNIITDNEALAIDLELSNNQNLTLATIYYPNRNPNLTLYHQQLIRQFLTRFSRSDWFLAMLKISTEHGSKVPVEKFVSETENNIEQHQAESCSCYSS